MNYFIVMQSLSEFSIPNELSIRELREGYPVIDIRNAHATAVIALHGAHVTSFHPKGQKPVIFTSDSAIYQEGKAIRGGIPICWPWFNAHPTDSSMPSHGFARNRFWKIISTTSHSDYTEVILSLPLEGVSIWPHQTETTVTIRIGKQLSVSLLTKNNGDEDCTVGGALHSYFSISDIEEVTVSGFHAADYLDTVVNKEKTQNGAIRFSDELDRIYTNSSTTSTINDPLWRRDVIVEKSGSQSTVVWNPWVEKSASMGDLGNSDYKRFLCIEAANALEDTHLLEPGESHTLSTTIYVR